MSIQHLFMSDVRDFQSHHRISLWNKYYNFGKFSDYIYIPPAYNKQCLVELSLGNTNRNNDKKIYSLYSFYHNQKIIIYNVKIIYRGNYHFGLDFNDRSFRRNEHYDFWEEDIDDIGLNYICREPNTPLNVIIKRGCSNGNFIYRHRYNNYSIENLCNYSIMVYFIIPNGNKIEYKNNVLEIITTL